MSMQDARRYVDLCHAEALSRPDPVGYLRTRQAEAERRYFITGSRYDLERCRAFSESLDQEPFRV